MAFLFTPTGKATLELASLGLVWAGTLVIIFGGIPALASVLLTGADDALLRDIDGALLTAPPDPAAVEAYRRYIRWAWVGMALITLGTARQAIKPGEIVLAALQSWWRS